MRLVELTNDIDFATCAGRRRPHTLPAMFESTTFTAD